MRCCRSCRERASSPPPSATPATTGRRCAATSTTVGWRSTTTPPNDRFGRWPSAGRTISSPAPTAAANALRPSTPCSKPPSSIASTRKPGSATCSPAYPPTPSTASPTCSPGTSASQNTITPRPESNPHARITAAAGGRLRKMHSVRVNDRRLKRIIRSVQALPGQDLFQYLDADANRQKITSRDINDYLQEISGQPFTAKDFRTPRLGVAVEGHPGRLPKNL